jgi:predicted RNA-binding Zn ribbon-like protein
MDVPLFAFDSGNCSLDFANTWGSRVDPSTDRLHSYPELVAWGVQGGILGAGEGRRLLARAARQRARSREVVERARQLREAIYGSFSRAAAGRRPRASELEVVNRELAGALPHLCLRADGPRCRLEWSAPDGALDRMLWPVARAAAELLSSANVGRVRECASETCTWLFLDDSRNRRRRWCDMASCGNRAKARRYYERHRRD